MMSYVNSTLISFLLIKHILDYTLVVVLTGIFRKKMSSKNKCVVKNEAFPKEKSDFCL